MGVDARARRLTQRLGNAALQPPGPEDDDAGDDVHVGAVGVADVGVGPHPAGRTVA